MPVAVSARSAGFRTNNEAQVATLPSVSLPVDRRALLRRAEPCLPGRPGCASALDRVLHLPASTTTSEVPVTFRHQTRNHHEQRTHARNFRPASRHRWFRRGRHIERHAHRHRHDRELDQPDDRICRRRGFRHGHGGGEFGSRQHLEVRFRSDGFHPRARRIRLDALVDRRRQGREGQPDQHRLHADFPARFCSRQRRRVEAQRQHAERCGRDHVDVDRNLRFDGLVLVGHRRGRFCRCGGDRQRRFLHRHLQLWGPRAVRPRPDRVRSA
jgi:hypothetical protein